MTPVVDAADLSLADNPPVGEPVGDFLTYAALNRRVLHELGRYCGVIGPSTKDISAWPESVCGRWKKLNERKSPHDLAVLSWNTNGRLELRGCRESLLRQGCPFI